MNKLLGQGRQHCAGQARIKRQAGTSQPWQHKSGQPTRMMIRTLSGGIAAHEAKHTLCLGLELAKCELHAGQCRGPAQAYNCNVGKARNFLPCFHSVVQLQGVPAHPSLLRSSLSQGSCPRARPPRHPPPVPSAQTGPAEKHQLSLLPLYQSNLYTA